MPPQSVSRQFSCAVAVVVEAVAAQAGLAGLHLEPVLLEVRDAAVVRTAALGVGAVDLPSQSSSRLFWHSLSVLSPPSTGRQHAASSAAVGVRAVDARRVAVVVEAVGAAVSSSSWPGLLVQHSSAARQSSSLQSFCPSQSSSSPLTQVGPLSTPTEPASRAHAAVGVGAVGTRGVTVVVEAIGALRAGLAAWR